MAAQLYRRKTTVDDGSFRRLRFAWSTRSTVLSDEYDVETLVPILEETVVMRPPLWLRSAPKNRRTNRGVKFTNLMDVTKRTRGQTAT